MFVTFPFTNYFFSVLYMYCTVSCLDPAFCFENPPQGSVSLDIQYRFAKNFKNFQLHYVLKPQCKMMTTPGSKIMFPTPISCCCRCGGFIVIYNKLEAELECQDLLNYSFPAKSSSISIHISKLSSTSRNH